MTKRPLSKAVAGVKLAGALCDYLEAHPEYPRTAHTALVLNDLLCDIERAHVLVPSLYERVSAQRQVLLDIVREAERRDAERRCTCNDGHAFKLVGSHIEGCPAVAQQQA